MRVRVGVGMWCLAMAIGGEATAAVVDAVTVIVRIYDVSRQRPGDLSRALETAAPILASAAIDPAWVICGGEPEPARCAVPLAPGELAIRLLRGKVEPSRSGGLPLGEALIDRHHGGVLATVYVDRVQRLAAEVGVSAATLLGRAVAHELGHLLLSSRVHSRDGVMRPRWSRAEVARGSMADWHFSEQDALAIRERLAARATANIVWATE